MLVPFFISLKMQIAKKYSVKIPPPPSIIRILSLLHLFCNFLLILISIILRLQLCRTLPKIKQYLMFPNNDESLSNLERVVRELLASEQNALSRQLIQQVG